MAINGQIRDEKLQHDINKEATIISALSSDKKHKYEYLTGKKLNKKYLYKSLNYNFTTKDSRSIHFIKFKGPFSYFKKIRDGDISLEMAEEDQEKFKREFGQIKSGNPKHKARCSYIQ